MINRFFHVIILSSLVVVSCRTHQDKDLVGTYSLIAIEEFDSISNSWQESNWMKGGNGKLIYHVSDTMQVEFLPSNYTSDSLNRYAYRALYSFDKSTDMVTHTRIEHTDSNEIGKVVQRKMEFRYDTLVMSAPEFSLKLTWLKLP